MEYIPYMECLIMPDESFPVNVFVNNMLSQVHPHWHEEMEILYVISGMAIQQINGNSFSITKGDIVIIGCNDIHSTRTQDSTQADILVFQFNPSILKTIYYLDNNTVNNFLNNLSFPDIIKSGENPGISLYTCLMNIKNLYLHPSSILKFKILSEILKLAVICLESFNNKDTHKTAVSDKTKGVLKKAFNYIDNCFNERITLKDAAKASCYSVPHFSRLFKNCTGMTFTQYLSSYRITKACDILTRPDNNMTIYAIAYSCGFSSIATFLRTFKKFKKCTPKEYIIQNSKKV